MARFVRRRTAGVSSLVQNTPRTKVRKSVEFVTTVSSSFEIRFPTILTKSERASWHHAVAKCDLFSHSKGIGDSRSLTVSCTTREEFGAHFAYSSLPTKTRLEVDRVYEICQLKGGYGWEVSRGEIAEMLTHPEGLSAPIRELLNKHNVNS